MAAVHVLNVTPEEIRAGVAVYADDTRELLQWLYGYASAVGSLDAVGAQLEYDPATIRRIWQGSMTHCTDQFRAAVQELRTRVSRQRVTAFAETEITQAIWRTCDLAMREGEIVAIIGPTGSGKTATCRRWQEQNNHGRAVYVDVPVPCRLRTLTDELSRQMGFTSKAHRKGHQIMDLVARSLDSRNVLVLDEVGRMLPGGRGHDTTALEFVRRLHDAQGVGLVLTLTYTSMDEIQTGRMQGYLEQLLGRIADRVLIPETPLDTEADAIVRAFAPTADKALIRAVGTFAASHEGRWRPTVKLLQRAVRAAAVNGVPMSVDLWHGAVAHRAGQKAFKGSPIKLSK